MQSNTRILHFIASDGLYGAESVILNLSSETNKMEGQQAIIGCIVSDLNHQNALFDRALELGLDAVKIKVSNRGVLFDLPKAAKQIKNLDIDIIHSHGYKPSVYGFIISRLISVKIMATCHLWFEPKKMPLKTRFLIKLELFFYRWFSQLVGVSEPIKTILLNNGLKNSAVEVVANGVDSAAIDNRPELRAKMRQQLFIPEDSYVVVNSGRLTKQKAQWVLVESAKCLRSRIDNFIFIIVGSGELEQELLAKISEYGLDKHVRLLGFWSEMKEILAMSDCFALPSIDEGMPMSLLEAVAAELPVIATDVGDITKLVTNNKSGLIIPMNQPEKLADAILNMRSNLEQSQQYALDAKSLLISQYSSEAMAKSYSAIYKKLCNAEY